MAQQLFTKLDRQMLTKIGQQMFLKLDRQKTGWRQPTDVFDLYNRGTKAFCHAWPILLFVPGLVLYPLLTYTPAIQPSRQSHICQRVVLSIVGLILQKLYCLWGRTRLTVELQDFNHFIYSYRLTLRVIMIINNRTL